jgi:hypothetical protein
MARKAPLRVVLDSSLHRLGSHPRPFFSLATSSGERSGAWDTLLSFVNAIRWESEYWLWGVFAFHALVLTVAILSRRQWHMQLLLIGSSRKHPSARSEGSRAALFVAIAIDFSASICVS